MSDVAKELVVKIGHLQAKGEAAPLTDLVISLAEHAFSADELISSGLSKLVGKLRKHDDERVRAAAIESVNRWKALFELKPAAPIAPKPEPKLKAEAKAEPKAEPKQSGAGSSAMAYAEIKGADASARNQALGKLGEVFSKVVSSYADFKLSADEVEGVDPKAIAMEIEACMYSKLGPASGGGYKNKLRSLLFNLKDVKNTELVTRVVCGSLAADDLVTMDPKEMASSETKKWREQVAEYKKMELMDNMSYQRYAFKGRELPDGLFVCPKCKSKKTQYSEKQTRSADEPTTKFCHCSSCDYRWKFC